MDTKPESLPAASDHTVVKGVLVRAATVGIFFALIGGILFWASGRLNWTWAWIYLGICLVSMLINGAIMLRTNPATIAERGRPQETKDWDKVVGGLWALAIYFALPLVAGLDTRFGWTSALNVAWHVAGVVVLTAALGLTSWAMIANAYFSTAVRIQIDRGHTVCRSGPYRFVRHPGYVGFILQALGTSILLGSWWALIPALIAAALMTIRTALEDRTLQSELPDYQDYVQEVRYRLIPGIW